MRIPKVKSSTTFSRHIFKVEISIKDNSDVYHVFKFNSQVKNKFCR